MSGIVARSFFALLATLLLTPLTGAQDKDKARDGLTQDEMKLLDKLRRAHVASHSQLTRVKVGDLKVGASGQFTAIKARVLQVIDTKTMLVVLTDAVGEDPRSILVRMKCSTKGITDDQRWGIADWQEMVGSETLKVTDTATYKSVDGASKTTFVLEPFKEEKGPSLSEKEQATLKDLESRRLAHIRQQEKERKEQEARKAQEEIAAVALLRQAKALEARGFKAEVIKRYDALIKKYPDTKAAIEAREALKKLKP